MLNDYITADLFNCQQFTLKSIDFNEEESSALLTYISQEKTSAARCPDCGGRAYVQSRNTCDLKDMPVFYGITQTIRAEMPDLPNAVLMEYTVKQFAEFFDVSEVAAKIRAIELGFDQAAGVLNYVDGKKCPPFSFAKGTLKKDQTFVIDWTNAILAPLLATDLTDDIKEGRFLHVNMVQRLAFDRNYFELVNFLEEHRKEYVQFILYGDE